MFLRERKRNRLKNFDYSESGYYFVTICAINRIEYFGDIANSKMILNKFGRIVNDCWFDLPKHYPNCELDEFVIMPNHVHCIVIVKSTVGNGFKPFPTKYSLSEIIRGFKTFSSRKINEIQHQFIFRWQKSFYDHIIRDEYESFIIRRYIKNNPLNWDKDRNNPKNL